MPARPVHLALAACFLASGCATVSHVAQAVAPTREQASAHRGQLYARQNCAGCHEIGFSGTGANARAPAFGQIRQRFSAPGLIRELQAIGVVGHYDMKPRPIDSADASDVVAYIQSLKRP